MRAEPRTWVLSREFASEKIEAKGPRVAATGVRVVELDPVLDLLAEAEKKISTRTLLHVKINAFLSAARGSST